MSDDKQTGKAESGDATTAKPVRRNAPVKKDHATKKRREADSHEHDSEKRVGPVKFVGQSVGELKQVVWPTRAQLVQYFAVVLVFVLFIIAFVSLLDVGFGWLLLKLLGNG